MFKIEGSRCRRYNTRKKGNDSLCYGNFNFLSGDGDEAAVRPHAVVVIVKNERRKTVSFLNTKECETSVCIVVE